MGRDGPVILPLRLIPPRTFSPRYIPLPSYSSQEYDSFPEEEIKHFVGMLDGLAFLPLAVVEEGMEFLKTATPEGLEN